MSNHAGDEKVLVGVDPGFAAQVRKWLSWVRMNGGDKVRLTEGVRSADRQMRLYGKGRTTMQLRESHVPTCYARPRERVVTDALPGASAHCRGLAVDWNAQCFPEWQCEGFCKQVVWDGMESGRFWSMVDSCHIQSRKFRS